MVLAPDALVSAVHADLVAYLVAEAGHLLAHLVGKSVLELELPAIVANGWLVQTMPCVQTTVERF